MSIEQNRNTAVKFYERIAARKFNQLAELCTDDFAYYPDLHTEPLIYKVLLIWKVQICRQRMSMICS